MMVHGFGHSWILLEFCKVNGTSKPETINFPHEICGFPVNCSLKPIHWKNWTIGLVLKMPIQRRSWSWAFDVVRFTHDLWVDCRRNGDINGDINGDRMGIHSGYNLEVSMWNMMITTGERILQSGSSTKRKGGDIISQPGSSRGCRLHEHSQYYYCLFILFQWFIVHSRQSSHMFPCVSMKVYLRKLLGV